MSESLLCTNSHAAASDLENREESCNFVSKWMNHPFCKYNKNKNSSHSVMKHLEQFRSIKQCCCWVKADKVL